MLADRLLFASICNRIQLKEAMIMARTANVFARVEPELKEQSESVLDQLGIPMSNAVGMFLRQIVLQKGIPFEMKLPRTAPLAYSAEARQDLRDIYEYIAYELLVPETWEIYRNWLLYYRGSERG